MIATLGELDAATLLRLWTRITARVVGYGFGLGYEPLERPKLGIFDGLKITIDPAVDFEMQCFLVLHLFGHSVQWVAPSYRPEIAGVSDRISRPTSTAWSGTSATPRGSACNCCTRQGWPISIPGTSTARIPTGNMSRRSTAPAPSRAGDLHRAWSKTG